MTSPASHERFQALVDEHRKILFKVCNSYCGNQEDREDLAQEIIVQLWRSFGRSDERCRFATWMYRAGVGVCVPFGRRFMRDIGGYNLNAAADFLATLAKFEDEGDKG